jgi:hypothetical protein
MGDKRTRDRLQFYGFRPGADDQPYICVAQPSPYLGKGNLPRLGAKLNGNCRRMPGF